MGLLLAGCVGSGAMLAQAAPGAAAPVERPKLPGQMPAHRAHVTYADGRLAVEADNSSLNQILREIARLTQMKITGGVAEERVYGSYGPDAPAKILAALLDGTESNMLLIAGSDTVASELVLTPRAGGPTPPSPSVVAVSEEEEKTDRPPDGQVRPSVPAAQGAAPAGVITPGGGGAAAPGAAAEAPAASSAPAQPAADTTQVQSPNGVKTPQQIYEQLIKMQQQKTPPQ